jgi:hypothetical protein
VTAITTSNSRIMLEDNFVSTIFPKPAAPTQTTKMDIRLGLLRKI